MTREETKKIIKELGGPYELARKMNDIKPETITPQAISQWVQIPTDRCLEIEVAVCGAKKCHELRPGKFPVPDEAAA